MAGWYRGSDSLPATGGDSRLAREQHDDHGQQYCACCTGAEGGQNTAANQVRKGGTAINHGLHRIRQTELDIDASIEHVGFDITRFGLTAGLAMGLDMGALGFDTGLLQ